MVAYTVDSTKVGTALVTGAGTITSITIAALPPATVDPYTPVTLVDAANAGTVGVWGIGAQRTLYSFSTPNLSYLFEPRPGMPLTPGLTAPTFPRTLDNLATAFSNGIFVKSCPAGLSITVNA